MAHKPLSEREVAEKPLIAQLDAMGWAHIASRKSAGQLVERASYTEVYLEQRFKEAVRAINLDENGRPWLDGMRLSQMYARLTRPSATNLLEINQELTDLLHTGLEVAPPSGARQRQVHAQYIDWEHPERNDFVVMSQFRVTANGLRSKFVIPDLVLFVNGIPLVVIEAKAGQVSEPLTQAIEQLRRYANRRGAFPAEGNERLFHANQLMIAVCGDDAKAGTITASPDHYTQWKTVEPATREQVIDETGGRFSFQDQLAAGMLRPEHLIDLIRHFSLFTQTDEGHTIKVVGRYQQYRAVKRALHWLRTGRRKSPGVDDERGGIIWHTQGSGKSFTMVFLVRAMRSEEMLRSFKIVVVTDRTQLQQQLSRTAELTDEKPEVARNVKDLKKHLARRGKDVVFAMIQKYRDPDGMTKAEREAADAEHKRQFVNLGELNTDHNILVLIDEAHRSHGSVLHNSLLTALPNCARIGFTGTPIVQRDKKTTRQIFGRYIDEYTIVQSQEDGATVPILYECRTTKGGVRDADTLDEIFLAMFPDRTPEELERIKQRWATRSKVLEATGLIEAKAHAMLSHYVDVVLPNGFKAQVTAVSRHATVRYREALIEARKEFVEELDALPATLRTPDARERLNELDTPRARHVRAWPYRDLIARLDFVPVISGEHNEKSNLTPWTDKSKQSRIIDDFKKPLPMPGKDHAGCSPVAFVIVHSMLLTGFDAPVEQVLYLDRHIKEAELLQAVARVNRVRKGKQAGYVVDFYGVTSNLDAALKLYGYEHDDVKDLLRNIREQIPQLAEREHALRTLFTELGVRSFDTPADIERCVQLLEDPKLRTNFDVKFKEFAETLDIVLPRWEARKHLRPFKTFGNIQRQARNRYRDVDGFDPYEYGDKVCKLIDDHVIAYSIDQTITPVSLTHLDFDTKVSSISNDRAKASEMEHAIRHHIDQHRDSDPAFYTKLSERLEQILAELKDQPEALARALWPLVREARKGRAEGVDGLNPLETKFFELLTNAAVANSGGAEVTAARRAAIRELTVDVVARITDESVLVGFWGNPHQQQRLCHSIVQTLDHKIVDGDELFEFEQLDSLSLDLLDLARSNRMDLTGGR